MYESLLGPPHEYPFRISACCCDGAIKKRVVLNHRANLVFTFNQLEILAPEINQDFKCSSAQTIGIVETMVLMPWQIQGLSIICADNGSKSSSSYDM
jgi:hypothetical protein